MQRTIPPKLLFQIFPMKRPLGPEESIAQVESDVQLSLDSNVKRDLSTLVKTGEGVGSIDAYLATARLNALSACNGDDVTRAKVNSAFSSLSEQASFWVHGANNGVTSTPPWHLIQDGMRVPPPERVFI